jgi:signal transduction histidine kinase
MVNPRTVAPLALLVLCTAAVWIWQWFDHRAFVAAERDADRRYGDVILAGAEGAMHRQCRRRFPDDKALAATLEDVRARVGATYLGLLHPDGEAWVHVGTPAVDGVSVTRRARRFEVPEHPGRRGAGPGPRPAPGDPCANCPLPGQTLEIRLEYPADRLQGRLQKGRMRFFGVSGALTLAFLSLFLFYRGRLRAAALRTDLAAADEKVRSLEFLRRLGAGLAHETKNPLGSVRGFAELLANRELTGDESRKAAARIVDETDRIVARLDEFMLLSRPAQPDKSDFALKDLLEDLAGLVRLELKGRHATLRVRGEDGRVTADREQVRRLFMNLLVNAAEAVGEGGSVEVEVRGTDTGIRVTVADDGAGVPEALRETLFEPYVTGRPGGTGLGLAIARRIALVHGWSIHYRPRPGGGTIIQVETAS